jgi:hypothetical protein
MVESLMDTIDARTEVYNQALHERRGRSAAEIEEEEEEEEEEDWMGRRRRS